jgi:O-antigen ligase
MTSIFRPGTKIQGIREGASRRKALIIAMWILFISILLVASSDSAVFLLDRILSLFNDLFAGGGSFEKRDIIYSAAWHDFLSSPLFGTSYLVSYGNSSPHNFILESLIATGLFGTIFLFVALFPAIKGILRLMDGMHGKEGVSLAMMAICSLVTGLTSSSISQTPALWILLSLVTVMGTSNSSLRRSVVAQRILLK